MKKLPLFMLVIFSVVCFVPVALAEYSRYAPAEPVTIGDFVYDDDYQPSMASCSTTIFNPAGTLAVNDALLTSTASGWHYYTFTPASIEGVWSATMYCGSTSTGDLIREDRSFIIASNRLTDKTLSGGGSLATESYVDTATATLKSSIDQNGVLISALNNISASDVWSYVGRDLDRPTIVAASTSQAVWSKAYSSLTEVGTVGKLIADNLDAKISTRSTSTLTAADVWNVANRTLSDYSTSTITAAIWGNANRTLTYYGNDITAADVWGVLASSLTVNNSIGKQLANNVDAQISTIPNNVWSAGSRSLTDYATSSIATAVWSSPARSLTTFGTLVTDIWSDLTAPTRQLTGAALTGGGSLTSETFLSSQLSSATSSINLNITSASSSLGAGILQNRSLISGLNNISAADVWAATGRTLTDYATSSIANAVWTSPIRSLSTFGTLVADIWSNITAPNRQLTTSTISSGGSLATSIDVANSVAGVTSSINSTIVSASSSLAAAILQNRALINGLNNISASDVWAVANRSLTDYGTSSVAQAVWSVPTSTLLSYGGVGQHLIANLDATISSRGTSTLSAADIWLAANRTLTDYATSSIVQSVWANGSRTLTNYGNDITAADVWNVLTSTLSVAGTVGNQVANNSSLTTSSVASAVWSSPTRSLTTFGSLVSDVWNNSGRTLTDYATSSIASAVWASPVRSLTTFGSLVSDIWSDLTAPTRQLTSGTLTGSGALSTSADVSIAVNSVTSSIITQVLQNRTLINNLNNISASDVWSYVGRDLDHPAIVTASTTAALWQAATSSFTSLGSIGKLFADNLDAKVSSRGTSMLTAADVWDAGNRTLTDYSTSSIALAVWENASRTLTSGSGGGGLTALDVWNALTSTLTTAGSIGKQISDNLDLGLSTRASLSSQLAGWTVQMSDASSIAAGKTYRAKVFIFNSDSVPTDPFATPLITLYDADRNVVASGIAMNKLSDGVYEYTYSVANNASAGLWEASASTQVTAGKTLQTNDFWTVEASPAQVIINSITGTSVPNIAANITITNEGLTGYEYHYEWCVVTSVNNNCGGNDDVFYASAAKFINPGDDWNTTLTATVPNAGTYFFKLVVYFGTEHSSASRFFTATNDVVTPPGGGGGGGGGGGAPAPAPVPTSSTSNNLLCSGADFNHDKKVNSIDFSILLAFWKTTPPFRNPCVDINHDNQVNSVDFSILLFEWGSIK